MLERMWRKLVLYWWECKFVQPLWKTVRKFLKKLKLELLYDPIIPLLGIYLKKMKIIIQKEACTLIFTAVLFTKTKTWKKQFKERVYSNSGLSQERRKISNKRN